MRRNIRSNTHLVMAAIIDKVSEIIGIVPSEIIYECREVQLVKARSLVFYAARTHFGLSLVQIGAFFNKDHATVIHGIKKVEDFKKDDPMYRSQFKIIDEYVKYNKDIMSDQRILAARIEHLQKALLA